MRNFKRILCTVLSLLTVCFAFSGCSDSETVTDYKNISISNDDALDLKNKIDGIISTGDDFSGTVYAGVNTRELYFKSFGKSDPKGKENIENDYCYDTGSISKIFTGMAVLKLESENKLDPTDTIDKYFDVPEYNSNVTIRNLIEMTSGFGSYLKHIADDKDENNTLLRLIKKKADEHKIVEHIISYELSQKNDSKRGEFTFSDTDYMLLAEIISKVSGMSYRDYITENIIKPLKLKNTSFIDNNVTLTGYDVTKDKWLKNGVISSNYSVRYGAQCIISNAEDINKLIDTIIQNKIANNTDCLNKICNGTSVFNYGFITEEGCIYTSGFTGVHSTFVYLGTTYFERVLILSNQVNGDTTPSKVADDIIQVLTPTISVAVLDNIDK